MQTKKYWITAAILFFSLLILGFYMMFDLVIIKYGGSQVDAVVSKVPSNCDKYNQISVIISNVEYEINISRTECTNSVYKVGQHVQVIKHNNYKDLVWPGSHPELTMILCVLVLMYVFYNGKKRSMINERKENRK